ncbi:dTMP kinase [Megamonas sp.]
MQGKLIIIEAGDGSGKATQTKLLYDALIGMGKNVMKVEYPDYASEACAPVKMYLRGEFGGHADDVNAYAASLFFAVDRYASYRKKWKKAYEDGAIILADRYTTSNMVHQAVKIQDEKEREKFLHWLWDTEFVKMGLPVPDKVIFLNMPADLSGRLIDDRAQKTKTAKDIHEKDAAYLARCHEVYEQMAQKYGWDVVNCAENGQLRSIEAIHRDVMACIEKYL